MCTRLSILLFINGESIFSLLTGFTTLYFFFLLTFSASVCPEDHFFPHNFLYFMMFSFVGCLIYQFINVSFQKILSLIIPIFLSLLGFLSLLHVDSQSRIILSTTHS